MSIYKTRVFNRWASKEGLTDSALCHAVHEMQDGLFDADLGGGLFKKRVAKQGQGKRGGYRTLLATNRGDKWFSCLVSQRMNAITLARMMNAR